MRNFAVRTIATTAALLSGLSIAAAAGPHYIGRVTGNPEKDTYGAVVAYGAPDALCITGPARYFGAVSGDAEKDSYAYPVKLVAGTKCPDSGAVATAE